MAAGATSAVRRTHGIPGYTSEAERIVAELAEMGIVVPTRRQAGTKYHRRTAEVDEDRDEGVIETEDVADEEQPGPTLHRRRRVQIDAQPRRRSQHLAQRRRVHWLLPLGAGMLTLIVLYVLVYIGDLGLVKLTNNLSYGPDHISIFSGVIDDHDDRDHPTIFLATLLHG